MKVNESLLKTMDGASLTIGDVKYIDLISEFERMTVAGEKKTYIIQLLADKFNIAERTIYRIIERLMQDVRA